MCGRKGVAAAAVVIIVGLVNFVCKLFGLCPNIDNILMSMDHTLLYTLRESLHTHTQSTSILLHTQVKSLKIILGFFLCLVNTGSPAQ